jgi:hypothetical protein
MMGMSVSKADHDSRADELRGRFSEALSCGMCVLQVNQLFHWTYVESLCPNDTRPHKRDAYA